MLKCLLFRHARQSVFFYCGLLRPSVQQSCALRFNTYIYELFLPCFWMPCVVCIVVSFFQRSSCFLSVSSFSCSSIHTKYYQQYLVLLTMVPRNSMFLVGLFYSSSYPARRHFIFHFSYLAPLLTPLEPQSRVGDKLLENSVVCPQNGTAVLKGLYILPEVRNGIFIVELVQGWCHEKVLRLTHIFTAV